MPTTSPEQATGALPARPAPADRRRPRRRGQDGIALVLVLFGLATLLMVTATGLLVGSADVRATRNYRGATQVHFVAESGISEALQVINGPGVIHFQNDVVTPWLTLWGAQRGFEPLWGFTYNVSAYQTAGDEANSGRLVATGNGPEGVKNVVVANIRRSNIPSTAPGAIYLAADAATNSNFNGNAFTVDGNDHNYTGGLGSAPPVPGISARNDTNTQETINSLSSGQKDNVTGLGYLPGPPIVPSIKTSPAAPTAAQLDQMITDLLARGPENHSESQVNGNVTLGTTAAPKIVHFTNAGGVTIKANGNAQGAGIMIVEGNLTIQGNFNYKGLILVRGSTNVTEVTGNATVYGSIWTSDIQLQVAGSAVVNYSTQALALANTVAGGGALPSPVIVTSLVDCADVPANTGGCP